MQDVHSATQTVPIVRQPQVSSYHIVLYRTYLVPLRCASAFYRERKLWYWGKIHSTLMLLELSLEILIWNLHLSLYRNGFIEWYLRSIRVGYFFIASLNAPSRCLLILQISLHHLFMALFKAESVQTVSKLTYLLPWMLAGHESAQIIVKEALAKSHGGRIRWTRTTCGP